MFRLPTDDQCTMYFHSNSMSIRDVGKPTPTETYRAAIACALQIKDQNPPEEILAPRRSLSLSSARAFSIIWSNSCRGEYAETKKEENRECLVFPVHIPYRHPEATRYIIIHSASISNTLLYSYSTVVHPGVILRKRALSKLD